MHDAPEVMELATVRQALRHQYLAALAMLREALRHCPDTLWDDATASVSCRDMGCEAAFFTRYYLHPNEAAFRPWPGMHPTPSLGDDHGDRPAATVAPEPTATSRAEVRAYVDHVIASLDASLAALDLAAPKSGFYGYRMSKLEHQLFSLRQLQHHTAQLVDRVRQSTGEAIPWVVSDRSDEVN